MPELPEVETMVRGLRPALEGAGCASSRFWIASLVHGCSAAELTRFGAGRDGRRRGSAREVGRHDPG